MDDDQASNKVAVLVEEAIERFERKSAYSLETDQPKHASWITIDANFKKFGQDGQTAIFYDDAGEMRLEGLRLAKEVFTAELLEFVRSGDVVDLTLRIGPNTLWDTNLNEDDDVESEDNA